MWDIYPELKGAPTNKIYHKRIDIGRTNILCYALPCRVKVLQAVQLVEVPTSRKVVIT